MKVWCPPKRATLLLVVCVTFFGHVAPLCAQERGNPASADEADVEFRLGNDAYRDGNFKAALSHYFASNRLVPNHNVLFNIAKCYENLDRFVEAYRYYQTYLKGVKDPKEAKAVRGALHRIRKRVGLLRVKTTPPGATIYLNRRDLGSYGVTPAEVAVKPGKYDVIVDRAGWETQTLQAVSVGGGHVVEKSVTLSRREGTVALKGSPKHVHIRTLPNGTGHDVELPGNVKLPLGAQKLEVSAPGYKTAVLPITVREHASVSLSVRLQRQTGTLVVQSTEPGSSIIVDKDLVGFAPAVVKVPVGKHKVTVRAEGFQPYRADVTVTRGSRLEVDATLTGADEVAAASRVAESVRDAPASVSLISSREIESFGYFGTHDALEGTRGVYYTNDGTYLLPGIRGYGPFGQFGNRTLVLIDGHSMNDSWLEASFHDFELLSDIYGLNRIELIRGPNSVLYGSGAFQGVINLVSDDPADPYGRSRVGIGAVNDHTARAYAHVRHTFKDGGIEVSGGEAYRQPHDFLSPARVGSMDNPTGIARDVGDFNAPTAHLAARWKGFQLYSFYHTRNKQSPTGEYETIYGDSRTHEQDTRAFTDVRWSHDLQDVARIEARAYWDYYAYRGTFPYEPADGGLFTDTFHGDWAGAEARLTLRPFSGARWGIGLEGVRHLLHHAHSFYEDGTVTLDTATPFWKTSANAIVRQDFSKRFAIWAGARYDLWLFDSLPKPDGSTASKTISNVNPRLVLLAHPVVTGTLKLIGSRGFRAPSVYELTYNDGGQTQISSPGLSPENIWSGEAEYTQQLGKRWEAVVAAYTQRIANRIEVRGAATMMDPLQFKNIPGSLWSGGVELEVRRPIFRGWMASAQYSLQRTREGAFGTLFQSGDNVPNSPAQLASLKLMAPIIARKLRIANRVVFESSRIDRNGGHTQPALVWDATFSGAVGSLPLRWTAGVRNLLNWQYAHPVGDEVMDVTLQQPGRTFMADLAYTF